MDLHYRSRLLAVVGCPELWQGFQGDPLFRRVLFLYWKEIAEKHQIGWAMDHYDQLTADLRENEQVLQGMEFDAPVWRARAASEYITKTRFISSFRHASEQQHAKHWTFSDTGQTQLVRSTKRGPAKFFHKYSMQTLEFALYDAVRFNWRRIAEDRIPFLFVEFANPVGASEGEIVNHVRFSLEYATGLVHSQPILQRRKPAGEIWLSELESNIWPNMEDLLSSPTLNEDWEL